MNVRCAKLDRSILFGNKYLEHPWCLTNHSREKEQNTWECKYEMRLNSDWMYFVIDRDRSSKSWGRNLLHHWSCKFQMSSSLLTRVLQLRHMQGIEGVCGRRGNCHTLKGKMVGNTDEPLMHPLMSISSKYYAPICNFQGSFWIFNSSAMWLYSWITNFVVVLSLEGESLIADFCSNQYVELNLPWHDWSAQQVSLWDFQTVIHILTVLNTFYFRSRYPGKA